MEENEEDQIEVILFENAAEVNFDELIKEEEFVDELEEDIIAGSKNNVNKNSIKNEDVTKTHFDKTEIIDLETQVKTATNENKIFMKFDYTHEKPWLHHIDKSAWFNYNFNERSFKMWVQKLIDRRIEKAKRHQIENVDNFANHNLNDLKMNSREENMFSKYKSLKEHDNSYNVDKEEMRKKNYSSYNYDDKNIQKWKKQKIMDSNINTLKNTTRTDNLYNNHLSGNTNKETMFDMKGKENEKTNIYFEEGKEYYNEKENEMEKDLYNLDDEPLCSNNITNHIFHGNQKNIQFFHVNNVKSQRNNMNNIEKEENNTGMEHFQKLVNFFKENKDI